MESPLVLGATVAAAAWSGRFLIGAWQAFKARPVVPRVQRFYKGGFEQKMTRREAALILGVRESAVMEKIKEAHRRVMVANHPDAGGSHYLASKINEAKEVMSGKTKDNFAKVLPSGRTYFLTCPEDVIIFLIINNLTKTSEENRGVMYEK